MGAAPFDLRRPGGGASVSPASLNTPLPEAIAHHSKRETGKSFLSQSGRCAISPPIGMRLLGRYAGCVAVCTARCLPAAARTC